jgi:hypothetical protein
MVKFLLFEELQRAEVSFFYGNLLPKKGFWGAREE